MNIKGQGNSMTFVQGHSDSTCSNFFSLETARPMETKFHVEPPWNWLMEVSTNGLCHMIKMAAMFMYGKNLKNLLFSNRKADYLESWYVILVTQELPNLFK